MRTSSRRKVALPYFERDRRGHGRFVALNRASGTFTGSVKPAGAAAAIPFSGAVVTKANEGFGYFLGKTLSGRASLIPRP